MIKKYWSDPVWSKVIATAMCGLAVLLWGAFAGWPSRYWGSLGSWLATIWSYLYSTVQMTRWHIIALLVVATVSAGAWLIVFALIVKSNFAVAAEPEWKSYTNDSFYNVRWHWKLRTMGEPYAPIPYCPTCDIQLDIVGSASSLYDAPHTRYECPECGHSSKSFDQSEGYVEGLVLRQIQREQRKRFSP